MESFVKKYHLLTRQYSSLCLGIDPSSETFSKFGLESSISSLEKFCYDLYEQGRDFISVVKPQSAFFERFGFRGIEVLEKLVRQVRDDGKLVILDGKRGDIGSSNEGYGETYLTKGAPLSSDALTVTPYAGFHALESFYKIARENGAMIFIWVSSSNKEGLLLQKAVISDKENVCEHLSHSIRQWNKEQGESVLGGIIGATRPDSASLMDLMGETLFLMPGVGAQGATVSDLRRHFPKHHHKNIIVPISRGFLVNGLGRKEVRELFKSYQEEAFTLLNN